METYQTRKAQKYRTNKIQTTVYLKHEHRQYLKLMAARFGKTQNEILREVLDSYILANPPGRY